MKKKSVRDIDVNDKRVLVRVDYNVPIDTGTGDILDDSRIRATIPTIRYLLDHNARIILCSHLGRPEGKVVESLRLAPVARRLSELLGQPVHTVGDCVGPEVQQAVERLHPGEILLLENLRFHPEEEKNDVEFAKALASLCDIYVNDAFGTAHRAHASTAGVAAFRPAVAGLLMEKEIEYLSRLVTDPERPFAALIGGAKVSSKIGVLENLLSKVDRLIIGGGMASTFLKSQGRAIGDSLVEDDQLDTARRIERDARSRGAQLLLPVDAVIANRFAPDAEARTVPIDAIPDGWRIMDIGPRTLEAFEAALADARTVLWNGPMGVFEFPRFAAGTIGIARILARSKATTVAGGGETVAAIEEAGVANDFTHISTGGGASLEFLEGRELPGVAALEDRN
jgi:phosphoglycerate kinase